MEAEVTFCGEDKYCISVHTEESSFSTTIPLETMRKLRDKMTYFLDRDNEIKKEKAIVKEVSDYVWNKRSQRHERNTK